jgi:hypothetical protein
MASPSYLSYDSDLAPLAYVPVNAGIAIAKKDEKYFFVQLLFSAIENANIDDWNLVMKNWEFLKDAKEELPTVVKEIFATCLDEKKTVLQIAKHCEAKASEIKIACDTLHPSAQRQPFFHF